MKKATVGVLVWLVILCSSSGAWSKGETSKIEIAGSKLPAAIEITDKDILKHFNIWNGPGVGSTGADGVELPPRHLDPARSDGRFIDWPKGKVAKRPGGMVSYEVLFHIAGREGAYSVTYAFNPAVEQGYIYLPTIGSGFNGGFIVHDVEGNWFFSSAKWEQLVRPLIEVARR